MTASAAPGTTLEILRSPARLVEIAPAWDALWRDADGLAFQSHGWISAWWRTAPDQSRRALRIGLLWRGERLAAVLPLAIRRQGAIRTLEWAARDHSDYCDALVAQDCDPLQLEALWRAALAAGGFDVVYLNRLQPDALAQALAERSGRISLRPYWRKEENYRVAGNWADGGAWLDSQSKKTRQNYRRGRKLIEESGALRFRLFADDEPLAPVLERVAALKRKWLERHGRASDLFDEGAAALPALVGELRRLGVLRLFVLECDEAIVAVSINLIQRNRMMAFVTTYDPDFERASPGMLLMCDYIRWSIDHGLEEVDFLCGGEDFKRRFATRSLILSSRAGARTPLGHLALAADAARSRFAAWRSRRTAPAAPVAAE
ncbi:MAG: GNAT family N-acetyltransferase [Bosea sp. (in: a-proteobacteria)]